MEQLIAFLADGLLLVILVIGGGLFLLHVRLRQWVKVMPIVIMAGLTSLLVGKLMSMVYQPAVARPFIELGVEPGAAFIDNPGFPSDHMLLASVVVLMVYFVTPYRKTAYLLGVVALMMGVARVLALVHTPLDVFGGLVAGLVGALWYYNHRIAAR